VERVKVYLPETWLEDIDFLVSSRLYASRSEVVREAVRRLLHCEVRHLSRLKALGWWP